MAIGLVSNTSTISGIFAYVIMKGDTSSFECTLNKGENLDNFEFKLYPKEEDPNPKIFKEERTHPKSIKESMKEERYFGKRRK